MCYQGGSQEVPHTDNDSQQTQEGAVEGTIQIGSWEGQVGICKMFFEVWSKDLG